MRIIALIASFITAIQVVMGLIHGATICCDLYLNPIDDIKSISNIELEPNSEFSPERWH
jgi:hypothetical protein